LVSQGAEGRLWKIPNYLPDGQHAVAKERFSKSYRHPVLDERLTKSRCKSEVKCLVKCRRGGVKCPALYGVSLSQSPLVCVVYMEFCRGTTVRAYLEQELLHTRANNGSSSSPSNGAFFDLAHSMGKLIGRVHNVGVMHGDLTTSNMMYFEKEITLIDFGLARSSNNPEELAVDLYVLERALVSTHPELLVTNTNNEGFFLDEMLSSYKATSMKSHAVLLRLGQL